MLSRRRFISSLVFSSIGSQSVAQDDLITLLADAIKNEPTSKIFLGREPLLPGDPRWQQAKSILDAAPTVGTPYTVAKYLNENVPAQFRKDWPQGFANPLIVLLFAATNTLPSGDVTPWCAAFVSWCTERVGRLSPHSASSKSYRSFGKTVWEKGNALPGNATEGDFAVFKSLANPESGHVTFYVSIDPRSDRRIIALGGNQSDAIESGSYAIGGNLELESIRRYN